MFSIFAQGVAFWIALSFERHRDCKFWFKNYVNIRDHHFNIAYIRAFDGKALLYFYHVLNTWLSLIRTRSRQHAAQGHHPLPAGSQVQGERTDAAGAGAHRAQDVEGAHSRTPQHSPLRRHDHLQDHQAQGAQLRDRASAPPPRARRRALRSPPRLRPGPGGTAPRLPSLLPPAAPTVD